MRKPWKTSACLLLGSLFALMSAAPIVVRAQDERASRLIVSQQVLQTQKSLRRAIKTLRNSEDIDHSKKSSAMTYLREAEDALKEAQGLLTER